jgi:2-(1,2-epoxy-1,2-dihydrophenyl)acetyl-CoA isomerase
MGQDVKVEKKDRVLWLTLNRPEARNAIRPELVAESVEAFQRAGEDDEVRVIVLTGAGPAFSAGGDVKAMGALLMSGAPDVHDARRMVKNFHKMIAAIHEVEKPVICAVNGKAFGAGCNVALACDLRVASDQASFCWAFVHRGLVTDAGSTFLLQQLVGYSKAFELLTIGDTVNADESLRLGLVNKVVPHDQLMSATEEMAKRMAAGPPKAIAMIKRALHFAKLAYLSEALENEANMQALAFGGKEFPEGVASFLEKRQPNF